MSVLKAILLGALALGPAKVAAQAPFPGAVLVHGGWVPCTHQTAIVAGLGCVGTPAATGRLVTSPMEVGRYYRNASGTCEVKVLAVAVTYQHRRPMLVAETILRGGCPEVAYYFDPSRPPDGQWTDITETIPPEAR